jgi:hypothetical protein
MVEWRRHTQRRLEADDPVDGAHGAVRGHQRAPQARELFALARLGWVEVYLVAGAVALWLPLVRLL